MDSFLFYIDYYYNCIKFVDEFRFEQMICDKYTITKWK